MVDNTKVVGTIGIIVMAVIAVIVGAAYFNSETTRPGCVVSQKESISKPESGHEYRVYTENCGTFKVADEPLLGQWDSADQYGVLKEGQTYDLTTFGWRIPFLSQFPNIVEAK